MKIRIVANTDLPQFLLYLIPVTTRKENQAALKPLDLLYSVFIFLLQKVLHTFGYSSYSGFRKFHRF